VAGMGLRGVGADGPAVQVAKEDWCQMTDDDWAKEYMLCQEILGVVGRGQKMGISHLSQHLLAIHQMSRQLVRAYHCGDKTGPGSHWH